MVVVVVVVIVVVVVESFKLAKDDHEI